MPASFLSSAIAVCLCQPVILQRQAIQTFQSSLRDNLGGPFLVSLMAQMLDLYVIVSQTTAVYSRRDFQKHGLYIELTILDIAVYCTQPLQAAYTVYTLYQSLLSTYTPNTLKPQIWIICQRSINWLYFLIKWISQYFSGENRLYIVLPFLCRYYKLSLVSYNSLRLLAYM